MAEPDRPDVDDEFSALLAAIDTAAPSPAPLPSANAEMHARLARAQLCLQLLRQERARRRDQSQAAAHEADGSAPRVEPATVQRRFGRFEIRRELGQGGFGIVFLAHDTTLHRDIALKVPRLEGLFTAELRERFVREARAAAQLDHPNVVPIFESGAIDGICFIASAYCAGPSLAAWLRAHAEPVPGRTAAALIATLAEAVHYTHERGIVHRDLKPSNILFEPRAGAVESAEFAGLVPRISDFGMAKLGTAAGETTRSGMMLGTPRYMAPEQAVGQAGDAGPAADIHALGVMLYEVLTGRTPFVGGSDYEILAHIVADEPVPPRRLRPAIHGDLETICLKCLQKEPARRYATAQALADDLRRFLRGEPIEARPVSRRERTWRWVRRHPLTAVLAVFTGAALVALMAGAVWHRIETAATAVELAAEQAARKKLSDEATRAATHARRLQYASVLHQVEQAAAHADLAAARRLLVELTPAADQDDVRSFEWFLLSQRYRGGDHVQAGHTGSVYALAISPDGQTSATAGEDRQIILWNNATGMRRAALSGHGIGLLALAFTHDGKTLASASGGSPKNRDDVFNGEVKLWDVAAAKPRGDLPGFRASINGLAFVPGDQQLVLGLTGMRQADPGRVALWDLATGLECGTAGEHDSGVCSLALSPNGKLVASGGSYGQVLLWDRERQRAIPGPRSHEGAVLALAFDAANHTLASAGQDGIICCWNLVTNQAHAVFTGHTEPVWTLAFTPDGRTLASAGADRTIRLWDVVSRRPKRALGAFPATVRCLQFTPDGKTLIFAGEDRLVHWLPFSEAPALSGIQDEIWAVAFAPDGTLLATGSDDQRTTELVKLWDPRTGALIGSLRGHNGLVSCVAFARDGTLVSGSDDHTLKLWDPATRRLRATLAGHTGPVRGVACSGDGRFIASASRDSTVRLWDAADGRELHTFSSDSKRRMRAVAFSPDSTLLAAAGEDGRVRVWDMATREPRATFADAGEAWSLAFSPDGQILAVGDSLGLVRLWEIQSGRERHFCKGHQAGVKSLAFTPDGRTLASGSADQTIKFWQVATGVELATLDEHAAPVNSVAFASDGRMLVSGSHDGVVKRWQAGP